MPQLGLDEYTSWQDGVVTALRGDELPDTASPHGRDSALLYVAGGRAVVGKRRGASLFTWQPLEELGGLQGLAEFKSLGALRHRVGGVTTLYRFATTGLGSIYEVPGNAADFGVELELLADGILGSGQLAPLWAEFGNRAFVANANQQRKIVIQAGNPVVQNVGIARPPKPILGTGGAGSGNADINATIAGDMTGDYEIAWTLYNANTDQDSSLSDSLRINGATSETLRMAWPALYDTQGTHWRVYIRKVNPVINEFFTRLTNGTVVEGDAYDAVAQGWSATSGTGITRVNLTDASLLAQLFGAPDTVENEPPGAGMRGFIPHGSRLFAFDRTHFYYSKLDQIESFHPDAKWPVNPDDGDEIVVAHRANEDTLLFFKRRSLYGLFGTDPNTWQLRLIDPSVGCVSAASVVTVEGRTYWWSDHGPMAWDQGGAPQQIGYQLIRPTIEPTAINASLRHQIVASVDPPRQRVHFHAPQAGETRNNLTLAFNYQLQRWETDGWFPFDVASATSWEDSNDRVHAYFGGYFGKIYKWWDADVDGLRVDSIGDYAGVTLQGSATGGTTTTLVDALASFTTLPGVSLGGRRLTIIESDLATTHDVQIQNAQNATTLLFAPALPTSVQPGWTYSISTLNALSAPVAVATETSIQLEDAYLDSVRLIGLYAYVFRPDREFYERRLIVGALTTGLLLFDTPLASVPDDSGDWLVVISSPVFEWDTKWQNNGSGFMKKRYRLAYGEGISNLGATDVHILVYTDQSFTTPVRSMVFPVEGAGARFDIDRFDESFFGAESISRMRRRVGATGRSYLIRTRHFDPNQQFVLLRLGMEPNALSTRA